MKRLSILAAGLLMGAAAVQFSSVASGQGGGWVTLVDGTKMLDWAEVGKANWSVKDGALTADKITEGKDPSYLISKESYKDFEMKVEFWADDDANSGIFIRCADPTKIDAALCYEVNIWDTRPEPKYGSGAIVDVAAVPVPRVDQSHDPLPIAGNVPDARSPPSGCRFRDRCPMAAPLCAEEEPPLRALGDGVRAACHFA